LNYQLYLHIGYPKTGTTFLQQALFPYAQGINYIKKPVAKELAMIIRQDDWTFDAEAVKASLEKYFKPGKNLLSHEALVGDFDILKLMNSKIIADRLRRLFPEAKIIVTVRNQYDHLESMYKQYLHSGGIKKFRDFANFRNGVFEMPYTRRWDYSLYITMFDYPKLLEYYESLFGKENILVVPYELLSKDPKLFVQKLLAWMGIETVPDFKNEFRNQGYGARQVWLARMFNRFFKSKLNEGSVIPDIRLPVAGTIDAGRLRLILQSSLSRKLLGTKPITDVEMKEKIQKYFEKSNREMNERYALSLDQVCPGRYF